MLSNLAKKIGMFFICVSMVNATLIPTAIAFEHCATPSWNEFDSDTNSTSRIKSFASRIKSVFSSATPQPKLEPIASPAEILELEQQEADYLAQQKETQRIAERKQAQIAAREKAEKKRKFWQTMGTIAQVAGAVAGVVSESRKKESSSSGSSYHCHANECHSGHLH